MRPTLRQGCGNARLDEAGEAAPFAAMQARAALLDCLRRSGLGAWLATAYTLCVLALALAPAPAMAAFGGSDGVVLCSGAPIPDEGQPAPLGDLTHCKGCPLNPALAGPSAGIVPAPGRLATRLVPPAPLAEGLPHRFAAGLAQSRAPPLA
ncbi:MULTISPECIES: hypothetical protein [Bosea]|uniref:hypothetical protein n=1 Tax=Bosea TaxID=85413 RepID=UPI00214FBB29|nr:MULTISPECIES: hypothetical protein [Bosea]MCR4523183.1 hypothetical protein [Bosea sp. 47.2.35]MDR6830174.1 hypothetical protein [Bosea robiniae]MDR6895506.1 hypothetical protein [Bosea sp. BE109]MDR7138902.1 hypothetical protein [Bosea sp. BE168]MDR7175603.1 hypothetical protein [Bosea sp. BE271]